MRDTVWGFDDLGIFLGAIVPSVVLASFITRGIEAQSARGLAYQCVLYVLVMSALYTLARVKHNVQFAQAVNWTLQFKGALYCVFGAPVLALTISVLGVLFGAPLIPSAVDSLVASDIPLPVVTIFAVILGPLFEEIVFRGFLQPLLQTRGKWFGLIAASAMFSILHGTQNEWLWQYMVLLFFAGLAFGIARDRTGSTAAAFLLHMGFNLTPLTSSILQQN